MDKVVVWGTSGHALVVVDILRLQAKYDVVGFLDNIHPDRYGAFFCNAPILGGYEQLDQLYTQGVSHVIFGFGDNRARLELSKEVIARGFRLATAIHPAATVASDVSLGIGTVVVAGAIINPATRIGANVIINTCASVDHECIIEDGAHIGPGTRLGGRVTIKRGAWLGIGATVKDRVTIGAGTTVGAGAVVIGDLPANVVAYGVPARVQRGGDDHENSH